MHKSESRAGSGQQRIRDLEPHNNMVLRTLRSSSMCGCGCACWFMHLPRDVRIFLVGAADAIHVASNQRHGVLHSIVKLHLLRVLRGVEEHVQCECISPSSNGRLGIDRYPFLRKNKGLTLWWVYESGYLIHVPYLGSNISSLVFRWISMSHTSYTVFGFGL